MEPTGSRPALKKEGSVSCLFIRRPLFSSRQESQGPYIHRSYIRRPCILLIQAGMVPKALLSSYLEGQEGIFHRVRFGEAHEFGIKLSKGARMCLC